MFIVFGQNMGSANLVQVNSLPVPATLGGTSIRVTVGGTTVNTLMIDSSARQVAAVLPSNTPAGDGTLTLTLNNQTSPPAPIRVVPSSFGMFTRNSGGSGPAIVQNFISQTQQPINGLIAAAQLGQTVILWGTGLGPVSGNEAAAPLPGDLAIPVEVYAGNQPATIAYRGRSGPFHRYRTSTAGALPGKRGGCRLHQLGKLHQQERGLSVGRYWRQF
jgi:uncharacterized protein (TIGR03437 family)